MVVLGLLWYIQDRTRAGAIIRAGMDNKDMTVSLGINYGLVSTLVFLLGMALAGVAGVIGAPITGAYPSMGDNLLLLTLIVVVVGGTGYIQGHDARERLSSAPGYLREGLRPAGRLVLRLDRLPDCAAREAERAYR